MQDVNVITTPEDMSDAAAVLASILNRHGGFMYSFDLKNEALKRYRMSPSAQGRARKKARIKGVRTPGFGCSHSVCTWEWTPREEALAWAERHPITDSPSGSGGSMKSPETSECENVILEIRDLPASALDLLADIIDAIRHEHDTDMITVLKAERQRLTRRIAEIDRIITRHERNGEQPQ